MKKLFVLCSALFAYACASQTHEPSWQPSLSTEEGVTMFYWDAPTTNPENENLKGTRMLAHGSSFGPSMVFDLTFNCKEQSMQLNQVEVYSEEFAKGNLVGKMMDRPDRWEKLQSYDGDFLFVYEKVCNGGKVK